MIALLLILPIFAYVSMVGFESLKWSVINYEGKMIPYSLGVFVLFGYFTISTLVHTEGTIFAFSNAALIYLLGVWVVGFIDDRYGNHETKGLKGHFSAFFHRGIVTTGLLKVLGTCFFALVYVYFNQAEALLESVRYFLLLVWLPHLMNLFDTRPLRVWKVTVALLIPILLANPAPVFFLLIYGIAIFYLWFVLEGHRQAMLGDNGANTVGAIVALVLVQFTAIETQWVMLFVTAGMIVLAERLSFSKVINEFTILRWIDKVGVPIYPKKRESS